MNIKNLALSAALVFGTAGIAFAGGPDGHGPGGPGMMGGPLGPRVFKILKEMKLTPNQQQLVDQLKDSAKDRRRAMRDEHKNDMAEITAELEKASPDVQKLKSMADKRFDEMRAMTHQRIDDFMKLHATLTPEQRKTLAQELAKMPERGRWRHGGEERERMEQPQAPKKK